MKRFISAVLIPCLLLNFIGCYSYRAITIDELKQYPGENDIRVLNDTTEIIINRKIIRYESMDWNMTDSSILVNKKTLRYYMDTTLAKSEMFEIPCSKINLAEIEEFNYLKTTIFSVALATVLLFALAGLYVSQGNLNISGLNGNP